MVLTAIPFFAIAKILLPQVQYLMLGGSDLIGNLGQFSKHQLLISFLQLWNRGSDNSDLLIYQERLENILFIQVTCRGVACQFDPSSSTTTPLSCRFSNTGFAVDIHFKAVAKYYNHVKSLQRLAVPHRSRLLRLGRRIHMLCFKPEMPTRTLSVTLVALAQ